VLQLRLLRQRVVMAAQKAQADVFLHRLHYALPGRDAAAESGACCVMRKTSSTAQPCRQGQGQWAGAGGDFDAEHGFGLDGVGRSAH
jgi:hypothetical protein